ncbi:MEDS domain-containing protein [Amycolatopsis sp. NPDC101161]|uniref:MEDS domain-containing protein n=1 Tax=Amycolatopsis sp. NPDC101161 TaxID=3363940 RepID=UPI00381967AF
MTASRKFGTPGVVIEPGQHICALHVGEEDRDRVLLPFLSEGLRAGEKCLFGVHEDEVGGFLDRLGEDVDDIGARVDSAQLDIRAAGDTLLAPDDFTVDRIIDFWDEAVSTAMAAGYPFVRLGAEARWWHPQLPGMTELFRYEAALNDFTSRYPQAILCVYDISRYRENIVVDLLKTHPQVLMCGVLLENPYYSSPATLV